LTLTLMARELPDLRIHCLEMLETMRIIPEKGRSYAVLAKKLKMSCCIKFSDFPEEDGITTGALDLGSAKRDVVTTNIR
jgi:hypothetical protein